MIRVVAALIEQDGKILIAQRAKEDKLSLKWEFPGGKIAGSETPEECLKRELKEELNVDIQVKEHFSTIHYDYPTWTIELLVYRAEITGGEMQRNVHNEIRWVRPREMAAYDFAPADIPLVEKIISRPLF